MKTKILVTHADYEPWSSIIRKGQIPTWSGSNHLDITYAQARPVNKLLKSVDTVLWSLRWKKRVGLIVVLAEFVLQRIMIRYSPKYSKFIGDHGAAVWETKIPDLDFFMTKKIESIFKIASLDEFDFLVLTTSSSYLNIDNLHSFLERVTPKNFAGGRKVVQGENIFLSGSFRVFSHDVVKLIAHNYKNRKITLVEDMALGSILMNYSINISEIPSLDVQNLSQIDGLSEYELDNTVHYRLKSGSLKNRNDVGNMRYLHSKISEYRAN